MTENLLPAAIAAILQSDEQTTPWIIGENLFIQTVTFAVTGKLIAIKEGFLILTEAAWIADTGRFTQAIDKGEFSEVEPVSVPVRVNTAAVVTAYHWAHPLPREQK